MRSGLWLLVAIGTLASQSARAAEPPACDESGSDDDRAARARQLFEEALRLEPGDPQAALAGLDCADRLVDRPAVALRIGVIAERLRLEERAIAAFERYLLLAGEAAPDRDSIQARIATLRQPSEPPPPPPAEQSPRRIAGAALAIGGGAVLVTGAGLLVAAQLHSDEVHAIEPGTRAWDDARDAFEQAELEQALGITGVVIGAAATSVGLGLALVPADARAVSLRLGPGSLWSGAPGPLSGALRLAF